MSAKPRRLRVNAQMRNLTRETRISKQSLILPLFVCDGENVKEEIKSLPNHYYYSADTIIEEVKNAQNKGINKFIIFGVPDYKDEYATEGFNENAAVQRAVKNIKQTCENTLIITDVCLCEYTTHGHCGIIKDGTIDEKSTLEVLAKIALSHAKAGADVVAPSDMMDTRVKAIREALDKNGYIDKAILSYSVKYSSAFYGPFREVAKSAPQFGDRKSYQMDYHNTREAEKEVLLDIDEGADMVMVKPALSYLDIIAKVKKIVNVPVCAYSVSGEYAMIKSAGQSGLVNEYDMMCETAASIYRAGADFLITYFAKELALAIDKGDIG